MFSVPSTNDKTRNLSELIKIRLPSWIKNNKSESFKTPVIISILKYLSGFSETLNFNRTNNNKAKIVIILENNSIKKTVKTEILLSKKNTKINTVERVSTDSAVASATL